MKVQKISLLSRTRPVFISSQRQQLSPTTWPSLNLVAAIGIAFSMTQSLRIAIGKRITSINDRQLRK